MPQTVPFPDGEAVVIKGLRDAGVAGGRIYSRIPPNDAVYPLVVAQRLGGTPIEKRKLDVPRIQMDVWGEVDHNNVTGDNGKSECRDVAEDVRYYIHELEGQTDATFNAQVTCVEDEIGPMWIPDEESGRPRYLLSFMVYVQSARL